MDHYVSAIWRRSLSMRVMSHKEREIYETVLKPLSFAIAVHKDGLGSRDFDKNPMMWLRQPVGGRHFYP